MVRFCIKKKSGYSFGKAYLLLGIISLVILSVSCSGCGAGNETHDGTDEIDTSAHSINITQENPSENQTVDGAKSDLPNKITEREIDQMLNTYDKLTARYLKIVEKEAQGDVNDIVEATEISIQATTVANKLLVVLPHFTQKQTNKFEEIQKRYNLALNDAAGE